ncbi:hypothetical protein SAMN05519104_5542 [Rhizobiales bacterium GAS188]|nr:hypothetical protein SAMN05519104_5542 [Rhizobiales bacterium GAS188]
MVRPSILAVRAFITITIRVCCSIGRSAGFAPLSTRVHVAVRNADFTLRRPAIANSWSIEPGQSDDALPVVARLSMLLNVS